MNVPALEGILYVVKYDWGKDTYGFIPPNRERLCVGPDLSGRLREGSFPRDPCRSRRALKIQGNSPPLRVRPREHRAQFIG